MGVSKENICSVCGDTNPVNFSPLPKGKCKICVSKRAKIMDRAKGKDRWYYRNIFKVRIVHACKRAKLNGWDFDLTEQFLIDLLAKQNNRCAYTGRLFDNQSRVNSISVDRIDSKKGYTMCNVQLVISAVNLMKRDLPEMEFLSIIVDVYQQTINIF